MMGDPVFILGSHKSGTSLLRSLLDGSPNYFAIPIEMHFFEYTDFWVDYAMRRSIPKNLNFNQVLARLETAVKKSNEKIEFLTKFGGDVSIGTGNWDIDKFVGHLSQKGREAFNEHDHRALFDAYMEAAYLSLKGELPPPSTQFVEKSVENAEFAPYLKKLYPKAKFIHIIRNPYAALVSVRKYKYLYGTFPFLGTILESFENSYYHAFLNPKLIDDYLIIKYEDLLMDTETVMRRVATYLGTQFTKSMLIPSSMGLDWKGNSTSGFEFEGISTLPLNKWKTEIFPLEIELVNLLLPHVLVKFNYEAVQYVSSPILPMKGEGFKKYFANRFYWMMSKVKRIGE